LRSRFDNWEIGIVAFLVKGVLSVWSFAIDKFLVILRSNNISIWNLFWFGVFHINTGVVSLYEQIVRVLRIWKLFQFLIKLPCDAQIDLLY